MYAIINAATNTIPVSFDATAGSLLLDGSPNGGQVAVINTTTRHIVFTIVGNTTKVPSSDTTVNPSQYVVPAPPSGGTAANTHDYLTINKDDKIYIKAVGGTATSGEVLVNVW